MGRFSVFVFTASRRGQSGECAGLRGRTLLQDESYRPAGRRTLIDVHGCRTVETAAGAVVGVGSGVFMKSTGHLPYACQWVSQNWIPSHFCHTSFQDMSSRPLFSADHEYGLRFYMGSIFLHYFAVQRTRSCFLKLKRPISSNTFLKQHR